jgi:hypothetical protein
MERKIVGYTIMDEGPAQPIYEPERGMIVTHAFILCKDCGGPVYHCMGPRYNCVCLTCWEKSNDSN